MYKSLVDFIWVLFHPSFWIQTDAYSEAMEEILNDIMNNDYSISYHSEYYVGFKETNNLRIWVSNYPYGAYTVEKFGLAKRRTRARFNKFLGLKLIQFYKEKE